MAAREGVIAVDRALSILEAFGEEDQELTLAELAKRTKLYKSTVLRLIKSLEKFGYLRRSEQGTYCVGSKALHLGTLYQRHFHTAAVVPPVLRQIVDDLKEGASFYVRDGDHRICLHRVDSTHVVRVAVHEGDRLPLTVGASSHVIRAFCGGKDARYEQIRRSMYAASYGERDAETAAVACPVFRVRQEFVGALTVSGPKYRIESVGLERILPVLFRHAAALTNIMGGDASPLLFAMPKRRAGKRAARA
jgi:DNA-binding IclR family transcriptional regulator